MVFLSLTISDHLSLKTHHYLAQIMAQIRYVNERIELFADLASPKMGAKRCLNYFFPIESLRTEPKNYCLSSLQRALW